MSYFRQWRRKLGVITLVTACLFMTVWMRSLMFEDLLHVKLTTHAYALNSSQGTVSWNSLETHLLDFGNWLWWTGNIKPNEPNALMVELWPQWPDFLKGSHAKQVDIPYWSIVLPLTALSGWLLISKSGTRKLSPATDGQSQ